MYACKSVEWNFSPGNAIVSNEVILHANAKSPHTPDGFKENGLL